VHVVAAASLESRGEDRSDVSSRRAVIKPSRRLGGWKSEVYLDRVALPSADPVGGGVPLEALFVVAAHDPIKIRPVDPVPVRGERHEERRDVRPAVPVNGDAD
jgi:hypothetical protein